MAKAKKPKDETAPVDASYEAPAEQTLGEKMAEVASDMVDAVFGHHDPKPEDAKTETAEATTDAYDADALADHPKFDKFK